MRNSNRSTLAVVLAIATVALHHGAHAQGVNWPVYGGDAGGMKYSPLTQIDRQNVSRLTIAWTWATQEDPIPMTSRTFRNQEVRPGKFQATPIAINDTLYVSTPYSQVVALDASTGREIWRYDPRAYDWGPVPRGCGFCHRGVVMWTDGSERRIFINSRWRLIALDAATGEPIPSFGIRGEVDLTADLIWPINPLHYTNTSPPVVYDDLVIVGSGMPDNRIYRRSPPGDVQAFDVRTGERRWSFHPIPQPGEFGNDTWADSSWAYTGSTNVWGPFTVDVERGLVYLPFSTPNNDYYGGHRQGDNLFAESIVCLDARTGERVWHFQTVHHGIWDYDLPAPPNLVTIEVAGRTIDAVAVPGKTGFTYVFDRVTGEPVWPIEERAVPPSDVPGEISAGTQPFPTRPAPFAKQGFSEDDLVDFTPALREEALELMNRYRTGDIFTPPSLQGTLLLPGVWGGANWGGAAFNPNAGVLFVRGTNWPVVFRVLAPDSGSADADYIGGLGGRIRISDGIPIHKPPYQTLTAIDLGTGDHVWQVPLGDAPDIRNNPAIAHLDLPRLGKPPEHGLSGPLATASGIVFASGSSPELYGFDDATGDVLWEAVLDGRRGYGNPMTYQTPAGRQFIVIGVSKPNGEDGGLIAFALTR